MKISVCLDKDNGMMFFGKRQSQDIRQRERLLELIGTNKLFMTSYSAKLFDDLPNIIVNEMPQNIASNEDYYFVLGKESTGIPYEILQDNFEKCIRLPMTDKVRALNVSNVAAIMMYEAMRQQNFPNLCEFEPETMKGKDYLVKK